MSNDIQPARLTPRPIFWPVLLVPATVQFVLHVLTNGSYGIFRDEYYYLACAERLALGYVDQPPFSVWVLAGWTAIFGNSVHSIRILPAVCGAGLVVLSGTIAARFGGGRCAQAFAGVIGAAPGDGEHAPSVRADRGCSPDARALRRSWAQIIKRVNEVDPLLCPSCGGEMRVIAFIIDHDVVDAILRHHAKAEARSPRGPASAAALPAAS